MKPHMKITLISFFYIISLLSTATIAAGQDSAKPYLPIGIFLGRIEEGARIFTPVRLLPFDHPEAEHHQFPNALQIYGTELNVLLWLGHKAGYELWATITRYPQEPSPNWPYAGFSPPDTAHLDQTPCVNRPAADAPFRGLRAVLFVNRQPVCFMVDTRNLTLAERGMAKPTTMGLDMTRAEFLQGVARAAMYVEPRSSAAVIFGQ